MNKRLKSYFDAIEKVNNVKLVSGLYCPHESKICLVCGDSFHSWKNLEAHMALTDCGAIQIEEMLVEQEILREERSVCR